MNHLTHKTEGVNRTKTMRFYPFVFSGKERDSETGFGHFGARYMDHELMTMWISVVLDVNADLMGTASTLSEITVYPSPYMVLTDKGYTKHYYAGGDRVCARAGGGRLPAAALDASLSGKANNLFSGCQTQCLGRRLDSDNPECIHGIGWDEEIIRTPIVGSPKLLKPSITIEISSFAGKMAYYATHSDPETEVYYYHGDHLGSANWITDASGVPEQHLQYLPYGERYVDQRISGYNERFTFTGKERDEETGYGYFGARYMDHELMTMWLSIDPMADKYPSISPYAYCAWNPVKLVDPDGRDVWQLDNQGNIVDCIENSEFDQLQIVDEDGNVLCSSEKYDIGTISELCIDGSSNTTFSVCGQSNAMSVFEFLADNYTETNNRSLEWGWATLANSAGMENIIGTTHGEHRNGLFSILINNNYSLDDYTHNHPSGDPRPSSFINHNYLHGDLASASKPPNIIFFTYTPVTGYRQYTGNGIYDSDLLNFTAGIQERTFDWCKLGRKSIK